MAYDAFISYSQSADGLLAPGLEDGLQRLGKPWYRRRALRIFRDQSSLSASPSLWKAIAQALDTSRYFLLMASPASGMSEWVRKEISHWLIHHSPESLLIVLTDGEILWDNERNDFDWEHTNAVPEELRGVFNDEPLYVDLRWARQEHKVTLDHPDFLNAVADLAAPIHGRSKDELVGEDIRQHKKTKLTAWSAGALLVLLAISAIIAAHQAFVERDEKEQQRQVALSGRLSAESRFALEEKRFGLAALLGVEANRTGPGGSDPQAQSALFRAVYTHPEIQTHLHVESFTTALAFSADGKSLASAHIDGSIVLWDLESKMQRWHVERPPSQRKGIFSGGAADSLSFSKDGKTLAITSGRGVAVWEIETGKLLSQLDAANVLDDSGNDLNLRRRGIKRLAISNDHKLVATFNGGGFVESALAVWWLETAVSKTLKPGKIYASDTMYFSSTGNLVIKPANKDPIVLDPETGKPVNDVGGDRLRDPIVLLNLDREKLRSLLEENDLPLNTNEQAVAVGQRPPRDAMDAIRRIRDKPPEQGELIVATATVDGDILLLDMDPGERADVVQESGGSVFGIGDGIGLSRDAATVLLGQGIFGTTLDFRDVETGRLLGEIKQGDVEDSLRTKAITSDAKTVVSIARDFETLMIYRAPDVVNRLQLPEGAGAKTVAISPSGDMLAVGLMSGRLMLWGLPSQKIHADVQMLGPATPITALAFSDDGRWLAIGSDTREDDVVRLWDFRYEDVVTYVPSSAVAGIVKQHVGSIFSSGPNRVDRLLFDPSGERLAVRFVDGTLLLWDIERERRIRSPIQLSGGNVEITSAMAFSPEGNLLVVASGDGKKSEDGKHVNKLMLVDIENVRMLGKPLLEQEAAISDVVFSETGREITVLDGIGRIKVLELDSAWATEACKIANRNLTCDEWQRFFGEEAYRKTCPELVGPEGC